jgi:hypothetical protein
MVAPIQKPAPAFKSTAVVDGLFEEISLSDYQGKWYVQISFVEIDGLLSFSGLFSFSTQCQYSIQVFSGSNPQLFLGTLPSSALLRFSRLMMR